MATELQVFVLVRVILKAPLVRASLVRITRAGTSTGLVLLSMYCNVCHSYLLVDTKPL